MRLDLVGGKPEERNGEASNWEGQLDGSRDFWRTETEEHIIIQKKKILESLKKIRLHLV